MENLGHKKKCPLCSEKKKFPPKIESDLACICRMPGFVKGKNCETMGRMEKIFQLLLYIFFLQNDFAQINKFSHVFAGCLDSSRSCRIRSLSRTFTQQNSHKENCPFILKKIVSRQNKMTFLLLPGSMDSSRCCGICSVSRSFTQHRGRTL